MPALDVDKPRRRILALDGGGIFGVLSLEFLARIEAILREHYQKPDFRLAEHFDFIAGTSVGAIMATCLSWGMSVSEIGELYRIRAREIFSRVPWYKRHRGLYAADGLAALLQGYFHEDDPARSPALLGTEKLKTLLLLILRNMSTGSAWPITNNPRAQFNDPSLAESNLKLPLWQLVRASAAAPFYFPPETIRIGSTNYVFADGGVTAYNNPAIIAFLSATQPCYQLNWPTGEDRLHLISIGKGRLRVKLDPQTKAIFSGVSQVAAVPAALIDAVGRQQDMLCRILGSCRFGHSVDDEIGDLIAHPDVPATGRQFTYVRYDHIFSAEEIRAAEAHSGGKFTIDNIALMEFLSETGARTAKESVRLQHLL